MGDKQFKGITMHEIFLGSFFAKRQMLPIKIDRKSTDQENFNVFLLSMIPRPQNHPPLKR